MQQTLISRAAPVVAAYGQPTQPGHLLSSPTDAPHVDYQLFRQAIVACADAAWTEIYLRYSPMVGSWVLNHPCFWHTGEEATYFVNCAFEKFWRALLPNRFDQFADLPALLKYLQTCVHSVIIDHLRKTKQQPRITSTACDDEAVSSAATIDAIEQITEEIWWAEAWAAIQQRLHPREVKLIRYRFLLELKPYEICAQFPQEFASTAEIYRTLQNALYRLRRDRNLKHYLAL